jgi:hydrogenase expression/formation protein HypD
MKFLDEYRDRESCRRLADVIGALVTRPWTIMEVCGGQTHSIVRFGLESLLPAKVEIIHGPGCPVCVTPLELIDQALEIAKQPRVIFCSFGDMLRVPGSRSDLLACKSGGADVRIVYSPLDILAIARANPEREVVFFAVGFETTAPTTALTVLTAYAEGLKNVSLLISHVLVPPALQAVLSGPQCRVQGVLAAGHVCTIMGYEEYLPLAERYRVPIVVTGFDPLDLLEGIYLCLKQLEEGRHETENQYSRSVSRQGNLKAQQVIAEVFAPHAMKWRGIGSIAGSGLTLRERYREFDAAQKFGLHGCEVCEPEECRSGLVLQGIIKPFECPAFGKRCTPENPLGAPMVSSEGACAAYYQYRGLSAAAGRNL